MFLDVIDMTAHNWDGTGNLLNLVLKCSGGGDPNELKDILKKCLSMFPGDFRFVDSVKRGLSYYVEDGFEVECDSLGAQKQIAGGGRYAEGIGWAIGVDRLILASNKKE